jgi:hypothetical protein
VSNVLNMDTHIESTAIFNWFLKIVSKWKSRSNNRANKAQTLGCACISRLVHNLSVFTIKLEDVRYFAACEVRTREAGETVDYVSMKYIHTYI